MIPIVGWPIATLSGSFSPLAVSKDDGRGGAGQCVGFGLPRHACQARAMSRSRTITASGLASRRLRARRRSTASAFAASQLQMKTAQSFEGNTSRRPSDALCAMRDRIVEKGCDVPSAFRPSSFGPQSGQALGWAWKRRSAGSCIFAAQASHMAKGGHGRRRAVIGHRM
jgi:hypothetical protein